MANALTDEEVQRRFKEWKANRDEQEKAWKARLARNAARKKYANEMKMWLAKRRLELHDLLLMYKDLAPKRAAKPVKSKKPLQPPSQQKPPKGDPAFRAAIRKARLEKGWTHQEVGNKTGLSYASIANWEAGRYVPKEETRQKLVKLFGLPADLGKEASAAINDRMIATRRAKANGATA